MATISPQEQDVAGQTMRLTHTDSMAVFTHLRSGREEGRFGQIRSCSPISARRLGASVTGTLAFAGDTITSNITATQLVFTDAIQGGSVGLSATFTSLTPGAFGSLILAATNATGLTYSLSGNTISLALPSYPSDGTVTATFNVASAAVPEPASLAMLGVGLAGLLAYSASTRKRRIADEAITSD